MTVPRAVSHSNSMISWVHSCSGRLTTEGSLWKQSVFPVVFDTSVPYCPHGPLPPLPKASSWTLPGAPLTMQVWMI